MRSRGRPRILQAKLKDGFYIEVCKRGEKRGVKIWNRTREEMEDSGRVYAAYKTVTILGEYKNGLPYFDY